jgi:hypothetical protein
MLTYLAWCWLALVASFSVWWLITKSDDDFWRAVGFALLFTAVIVATLLAANIVINGKVW